MAMKIQYSRKFNKNANKLFDELFIKHNIY